MNKHREENNDNRQSTTRANDNNDTDNATNIGIGEGGASQSNIHSTRETSRNRQWQLTNKQATAKQ